ncbi:MAG TPA: alpha/beta fold hydrolase [Nitrospirota bacterium]|nr:alpha/beta fold hydrolase [Nitrospirota bacterium]
MPIIKESTYHPPFPFNNGHLQTVLPSLIRKMKSDFYIRERIETNDDDFLDIDWARIGSRKVAIISHGLEGNSHRPYVVGMVRMLNLHGWDAAAWNYRGCSGTINRQLSMYHNGSIDDLDCVVQHVLKTGPYDSLALIGYSLGGNLTLVYLGKMNDNINSKIRKSVVFSVPCDLEAGARELAKTKNKLYMEDFLVSLHKKIKAKMVLFPDQINDRDYHLVKNFKDFDDRYTAPIHGFKNAEDYWHKCSSAQFIPEIKVPALIVNALNDPFLADACYPIDEAAKSANVYLEMPESGGHVGFMQFNEDKTYWSEERVIAFIDQS